MRELPQTRPCRKRNVYRQWTRPGSVWTGPRTRWSIIGILIVEGPVKLDLLEETLAERFLAIPRFSQRVEMRGGEYWWVEDPHFERQRHIRRVRLPGKGGKEELQRYIAELASEPLDKSRPLWQLRIVEHYEGGAAIVIRIHHAIGDGMALVGVMLSITDGNEVPRNWDQAPGRGKKTGLLSIPGLETLSKGMALTAGCLAGGEGARGQSGEDDPDGRWDCGGAGLAAG